MAKTDEYARKLHPWLRVVRNGGPVVNATRADGSTRVACSISAERKGFETAPIYAQAAQQAAPVPRLTDRVEHPRQKLKTRSKLGKRADDAFVNVFIEFFPERSGAGGGATAAAAAGKDNVRRRIREQQKAAAKNIRGGLIERRNFLCATVPVSMLNELEREPAIAFVHPSDPLKLDRPEVKSVPGTKKMTPRSIGNLKKYGQGEKVLIGIIDVGGFDFSHPDFLDSKGETRFVAIWDQGGDFRPPPKGFPFGSEFRKPELDAAIKASKKKGLPPAPWIERQSQLQPSSHGTHVASIAAGNGGICPKAKIAAVLVDIPTPDDDVGRRRATFSDSSRITHAVEYLLGIAEEEQLPIAINISLGTNGGSHDGAGGVSRWLDALLATPGRAICVAAGNAGQEKAQTETDLGFVMGRIHTAGQIPARGLEAEIEWTVIGDGIEDFSENELEVWYSAQDRFAVSLLPPGESDWIEVKPREYVENRRLPGGVTVSIYNELYHPTNGGNYVAVILSPNLDPQNFRGITQGVWRVRLKGEEVRDGRFDAWIERDDPMEIGREGGRRMFRFPSFFSEKSNVDSHSITSLACGHRVIAVANLDEARQRVHASSSQGPTRDGRFKPEIAAPGTEIVAANGFADPQEPWVAMTGTSMAAPFVTGVVGLMLSNNRDLTSAQCLGILQRTARPLAGASYRWLNDMGFGRVDVEAAMEEASGINQRLELRSGGNA
jgi:subtilisin family serine protease